MDSGSRQEPPTALTEKRIILGVSGSIAAFKAVALASELVKNGASVDVVMTPAATRFILPLSFAAITNRPVLTDLFSDPGRSIAHVSLGVDADALVVAPVTADCLAGLALGLGHNALLATAMSSRAPLLLAPAMETLMYEHPATQHNLEILRRRGAIVIEPTSGRLASGRSGRGRMAEPSQIVRALQGVLGRPIDLKGRRIVVTAGGTREPIDPVRFIGNHSSGKMGVAIAEAARDRGASVHLIVGSVSVPLPGGVDVQTVTTTLDLQAAVEAAVQNADVLIMAAAVADFRVEQVAANKIKRTGADLTLRLIPNPDILASIAATSLLKVGFAAETHDLLANAQQKLAKKHVDLIVANDVTLAGSGFGTDTNQVSFVDHDGIEELPLLSKRDVADRLLARVVRLLEERSRSSESIS
ncbi:MAG TPA: bifunctional phosphopantothenoylcysteine decarboxylase/phosphopantothenate--cysteine ligase CoaBC [Chloroflexota bacterium]|nr:bifunctional phosphopantothenoylcysteine decarboxylase/phosphopantothenate--cysteine ligase CoaBC [Chloroflexota bacterium]HVB97567.1 bifunctional phosphopantothenoylcysteine decarboxylase/phosphopantothenate--cysteine ligase CoaBC [Chloroflexota bacterium]